MNESIINGIVWFVVFMCFIMPFICCFIRYIFVPRTSLWLVMFISIIICWLLVQFNVFIVSWHLDCQLSQFDLDGNDFFTPDEMTAEVEELLLRKSNDTGRALAPITGMVVSIIYNAFLFFIFALFQPLQKENTI